MAYKIIGNVYQVYATEQKQTKAGGVFLSRSIILIQRRFDSNTGEEYEPNYPQFDFTGQQCSQLDRFKQGDRVQISFDLVGVKFHDDKTNETKFFTKLRAFKIEPYAVQQVQNPSQQIPVQQQTPYYAPQPQQQAPYYPPRNNNDGMPF